MHPDRYLRTFDVLNLLVQHKDGLRLTEIKDALDLPVSSVHNMLQTMVSAEVAAVTSDLRYSIGPRAVALALRKEGAIKAWRDLAGPTDSKQARETSPVRSVSATGTARARSSSPRWARRHHSPTG